MTSDHFDALCALENLKYLCLGWRSGHRATLGWLTDDKLADWISHFAGLHTLKLDWECSLTEASVVAISRSCPGLITCTLGWKHNLDEWKRLTGFTPLFPKLKALQLGKVEQISSAAPLVRYLVKSMQLIDAVFQQLSRNLYPAIIPIVCDLIPSLRVLQVGEPMQRLPVHLLAHGYDLTRLLNCIIRLFLAERRSMPSTDAGTVQ